jgi:hypothetical protein
MVKILLSFDLVIHVYRFEYAKKFDSIRLHVMPHSAESIFCHAKLKNFILLRLERQEHLWRIVTSTASV